MGAIVRSYHTIALGLVAYVHHVLTHIFFEIEPQQQTDKTTQPTTTAQFASLSLSSRCFDDVDETRQQHNTVILLLCCINVLLLYI